MKTNELRNLLKKEKITGKEAGLAEITNYIYSKRGTGKPLFTPKEKATILQRMGKTLKDIADFNYYYSCILSVSRSISKMETAFQKAERTLSYIFLNLYNISRNLNDYCAPYIVEQDITDMDAFMKARSREEAVKIKTGGIAKLIIKGTKTDKTKEYKLDIPKPFTDINNFVLYANKSIEQIIAHVKAIEILADYINMPELAKNGMPAYDITQSNAKTINDILEKLETEAKEMGIDIGEYPKIIAEPTLVKGHITLAKKWLQGKTPTSNITHLLYSIILYGDTQEY